MNSNLFFGWLLMTIGSLIATLSGGCGLLLFIPILPQVYSGGWAGIPKLLNFLMMLGMFSGIPFAVGCILAYGGRNLLRGKKHSKRNDIF